MKKLDVGSDYSGIGAFDEALKRANIKSNTVFACDLDKFARKTYIANNGTKKDQEIVNSKEHDKICDMMAKIISWEIKGTPRKELDEFYQSAEKMARSFSFYYPFNVYNRTIPKKPVDIYMTSPPCQGFSISGKRAGSILFLNSLQFIKINKPKVFIFENVKGLLSHNKKHQNTEYGQTFNLWLNYLGGKSINGNPVVFPYEDSVPYHIYHKVLNAKHFGVPQNRERVFIIGIREDSSNNFSFPKPILLLKRLRDILELNVPEKYYLSDEEVRLLIKTNDKSSDTDSFFTHKIDPKKIVSDNEVKIGAIRGRNEEDENLTRPGTHTRQMLEINDNDISNALTTVQKDNVVVYGNLTHGKWSKTHEQSGRVYDINGIAATIHTMGGGNQEPKIYQNHRIRKLTPLECMRLMDFEDLFKLPCSDSQTYKQAGNSIVVGVLKALILRLNLK